MDRSARFAVNGAAYGLRFTFRAFAEIERELQIKHHEIPTAINERGLPAVVTIFRIGLAEWARREKRELTVSAEELLDELPMQQVARLIGEGVLLGAVETPKATPAETPAPQGPPGASSSDTPAAPE